MFIKYYAKHFQFDLKLSGTINNLLISEKNKNVCHFNFDQIQLCNLTSGIFANTLNER